MNLATLDGEVYYYKSFYPRLKATALFNEFSFYKEYKQRKIKLFGKKYMSPRLEAFLQRKNNITAIPEMNLKAIHSHLEFKRFAWISKNSPIINSIRYS